MKIFGGALIAIIIFAIIFGGVFYYAARIAQDPLP